MPNYSEPRCGQCGQVTDRMRLFVKRAVFYEMRRPDKTVRSRTVMWLCSTCLELDADWNRPAYGGPGHTSEGLESARKIRGEPK